MNTLPDGWTEYSDEVEIGAGWKTGIVWLWAKLFMHTDRKSGRNFSQGDKLQERRRSIKTKFPDQAAEQEVAMTSEKYKELSLKEFDRAAEKFDDDDPSVYNMCRKDYPDVVAEVAKEPFLDLLDAGCGTGAMLGLFKRDYPDKNYTGVDLSKKMIDVAGAKHIDGIRFVAGDCEDLPFPENSFDVVTCSMSFHHYPNPEKFFISLKRVLRPRGRLVLRDMAANGSMVMWLINHIEIPLINKILHKGDVHIYSRNDIQRLCDISGLMLERYEVRKGFRLHCVVRKPR